MVIIYGWWTVQSTMRRIEKFDLQAGYRNPCLRNYDTQRVQNSWHKHHYQCQTRVSNSSNNELHVQEKLFADEMYTECNTAYEAWSNIMNVLYSLVFLSRVENIHVSVHKHCACNKVMRKFFSGAFCSLPRFQTLTVCFMQRYWNRFGLVLHYMRSVARASHWINLLNSLSNGLSGYLYILWKNIEPYYITYYPLLARRVLFCLSCGVLYSHFDLPQLGCILLRLSLFEWNNGVN